jgi:hypothetical protein
MWLYSLVILWVLKALSPLCVSGVSSLVLWDCRTLYEGDTFEINFVSFHCSCTKSSTIVSLDSVGHWSSSSQQKLCYQVNTNFLY